MTPGEMALLTSLGGGLPQPRMTMGDFEDWIGIRLGNPVMDRPSGQWSRTPDQVTGPPPAPTGFSRELGPQMRVIGRPQEYIGVGMSSVAPHVPPANPPQRTPPSPHPLVAALERQVTRPASPNGYTNKLGDQTPIGNTVFGPEDAGVPSGIRDVTPQPKSILQQAIEGLAPFGDAAAKNLRAADANRHERGHVELPLGSTVRLGPDGQATVMGPGPLAAKYLGEIDEETGLPIHNSQFNPETRQAYRERVAARTKGMKEKLQARRAAKAEERQSRTGDPSALLPAQPTTAVEAGVQSVRQAQSLAKAAGRPFLTREEGEQAWLAGVRSFERQDELNRQQARAKFVEDIRQQRDIADIAMRIFIARRADRDFTFDQALAQARTAYAQQQGDAQ